MRLETLQQVVAQKVSNYAIAMMIGDHLLGSGTLCTLDEHHGILTARHLFFEGRKLHAAFTSNTRAKLRLACMEDEPYNIEFEFDQLELMDSRNPIAKKRGPELLFVALPESPQLDSLRARQSFFPLSDEPEVQVEKATRTENCAWCLVGCPDVVKLEHSKTKGCDELYAAPAMASFGCARKTHHRRGWDYLDIPHPTDAPSFGSLGGDGFWKTPVFFDGMEPVAIGDPCLVGVVYQEKQGYGSQRLLRCHGPRSVYLKLEEELRRQAV